MNLICDQILSYKRSMILFEIYFSSDDDRYFNFLGCSFTLLKNLFLPQIFAIIMMKNFQFRCLLTQTSAPHFTTVVASTWLVFSHPLKAVCTVQKIVCEKDLFQHRNKNKEKIFMCTYP